MGKVKKDVTTMQTAANNNPNNYLSELNRNANFGKNRNSNLFLFNITKKDEGIRI